MGHIGGGGGMGHTGGGVGIGDTGGGGALGDTGGGCQPGQILVLEVLREGTRTGHTARAATDSAILLLERRHAVRYRYT